MDYTTLLGGEAKPQTLLERFQRLLETDLEINRILFFTKEEEDWTLQLNVNFSQEQVAAINVPDLLSEYEKPTVIRSKANAALEEVDVVIPLEQDGTVKAYVLLGDTNENRIGVSPVIKHLFFAQTISMITLVALENYKLFTAAIRQQELRQELELAAQLQGMLIPKTEDLPNLPGVGLATSYHPHYQVGGDFFDLMVLDDQTLGFCIADVSGKGIPAALVMTSFQANFRAHFDATTPLDELLKKLNEGLFKSIAGEKFITLFVGRYSRKKGILEYVNAGHNPPYFYDLDTQTLGTLPLGTTGIGMFRELPRVTVGQMPIAGNQILLCYTDGLVERRKNGREFYCARIIEEEIVAHSEASELLQGINRRIEYERNELGILPFDDISTIALRFYADSDHE